jgi:hypothetical protein
MNDSNLDRILRVGISLLAIVWLNTIEVGSLQSQTIDLTSLSQSQKDSGVGQFQTADAPATGQIQTTNYLNAKYSQATSTFVLGSLYAGFEFRR